MSLAAILGALKGVGAFLAKIGALLVPYLLGRSHAKGKATENAIERLDDGRKAADRVRDDPIDLERMRDKYRRRQSD